MDLHTGRDAAKQTSASAASNPRATPPASAERRRSLRASVLD